MTDTPPIPTGDPPRDLSQRDHRRVIGVLGLLLPLLLYVVAGLRPTQGIPRWELLGSVSAYYYTGAVGIFVGVLFALSLFLLTYPGYKGVIVDRLFGWIAGVAAWGVALFPTEAPHDLTEPTWWSRFSGVVHHVSAVVLFISFIVFSIWLFRKSNIPDRRARPPDKQMRDSVCLICGITMTGSVLWAVAAKASGRDIFWPESIAIIAFAISWLVKGEAHEAVIRAFRRALTAHER